MLIIFLEIVILIILLFILIRVNIAFNDAKDRFKKLNDYDYKK